MSIVDELAARCSEGRLVELKPLLAVPIKRSVWVTADVMDQLSPDTADPDFELEAGRLRKKLESVARGNRLVVGQRRNKSCDVKRLDPPSDEVWELRERPEPGIRVFFRFIDHDCIAATNIRLVRHLFEKWWTRGGRDYWPAWVVEIRRCKAHWRSLFISYPPHVGETISDYLSNATGPDNF